MPWQTSNIPATRPLAPALSPVVNGGEGARLVAPERSKGGRAGEEVRLLVGSILNAIWYEVRSTTNLPSPFAGFGSTTSFTNGPVEAGFTGSNCPNEIRGFCGSYRMNMRLLFSRKNDKLTFGIEPF